MVINKDSHSLHYKHTIFRIFHPRLIDVRSVSSCLIISKIINHTETKIKQSKTLKHKPQLQFIKFIDENKSYRFEFSEHIFTVGSNSLASYDL